jgi:hypothetical protein
MSTQKERIEALGLSEEQRAAVAGLLEAERCRASRWWTCLNELRRRGELPDWAASGTFGSYGEHDAWLASRAATDGLLEVRPPARVEIPL